MNDRLVFPSKHAHTDELVLMASRMAGKNDVAAVHLALPERPTYEELMSYQAIAAANNLELKVYANGLSLRPRPARPQPETSRGHDARSPRVLTAARSVQHHLAAWNAGFSGLSEGIR
jgi:hypothetical protein